MRLTVLRRLLIIALTLFQIGMLSGPVAAQAPGESNRARIVETIRIEGSQRIDPETVQTYMTVKPGDPFDPAAVNESLKRLFATGFFTNIEIREADAGRTLIVRIQENPVVNLVAFEGNLRIDDDVLRTEVRTQPRSIYTRTKIQDDVERILNVYRRSGRFAATVEPKLIEQPQNRVDVVYEINEGPLTQVERIIFIGNEEFSDSELRDEILTLETRFWRFWSNSDVYDPDRLSVDEEALRRFYLREGYADFRVVSAVAELTPSKAGFVITFTVDEGARYKFGSIDIESQLPQVEAETLLPVVQAEPDEWYNADILRSDVDAIADRIGEAGFAFAEVRPDARPDRTNRVINLTYRIGQGPRVFVNRIEIQGNVRTEDKVIRREFRLSEGDPFNSAKLRRSRERLQNLGFFETVRTETSPATQDDRIDIIVKVEEKSTGELSFGAGFSSADGPIADASIRERNLLGKGQDLRLGVRVSARVQTIDLSFTEPYFLDRRLSAGFDIFSTETDNSDESSFEVNSLGFTLRSGYAISEFLRQSWSYGLRQDDFTSGANASPFIALEDGVQSRSVVTHSLSWDTRDNRFNPTKGFVLNMSNEFAGLGGTQRFLKNSLTGAWYTEVLPDIVLSVVGRSGAVLGVSQDTSILDRFNLGGQRLRGFASSGVGPRDLTTDDALGGNYYYTGTVEVEFPLGPLEELGMRGRVFGEAGSLFGLDQERVTDSAGNVVVAANDASIRASVGVGVSWTSPFGPVKVDFGFPLMKESYDETQTLFFSFGTRF